MSHPRVLLRENTFMISMFSRLFDIFAILVGAVISYWLRFSDINVPENYQVVIVIGVLSTPFIFSSFGIYNSWEGKDHFDHFRTLIFAWSSVIFFIIVVLFLMKTSDNFSRQWIIIWALVVSFLLILFRIILIYVLHRLKEKGWSNKNIAIYGAGQLGKDVFSSLNLATWSGIKVSTFYDDDNKTHKSMIGEVPIVGGIDTLKCDIEENLLDEIWIALPLRAENRVRDIMESLKNSTITIRYIPDIYSFRLLNHSVQEIAGIPVINISGSSMFGVNRVVKAIEDRSFALIIILLISPLLLLIAISIKLSSKGPIIFKQMRHGWDGKLIKVYKFRSMVSESLASNTFTQAKFNDPRITQIGAFLRKTSLDELPQFFNVLQGRMSIVGPRPHPMMLNEDYKNLVDNYMKRHKVKPGITGWAQINGFRGETDTLDKMKNRVEYDLYYIENWSLWFDIKIIMKTIISGFIHKNAY